MKNPYDNSGQNNRRPQNIPPSGMNKPTGAKQRKNNDRPRKRKIQSSMTRSERQRKRVRTSFRRKISARIAFSLMTLVLAFLAVTIFFRVDTINSNSTAHYKNDEIIKSLGIEKGDNMFTFRIGKIEKTLLDKYPYLASAKITRSLPSTVNVKIKDSVPVAALNSSSGGYYLVDEKGKLLEPVSEISEGIPRVIGVSASGANAGDYIDTKNNKKAKMLVNITMALKKQNIVSNVDFINVSALSDIRMGYLGRLDVRLGTADDIDEKLKMLVHISENELSPSDVQILHLEQADTVYCPPTTKDKIEQSTLPLSDINPAENA